MCSRAIAQSQHDSFGLDLRFRAPKVKVECGAATGRVRIADIAAEPLDNLLDNIQTESGAAFLAGVGGVGLRELLK